MGNVREFLKYEAFKKNIDMPMTIARAKAFENVLHGHKKYIYEGDLIAGSLQGLSGNDAPDLNEEQLKFLRVTISERNFGTNYDHSSPNYSKMINVGIDGLLSEISQSLSRHTGFTKKTDFLKSMQIAVQAFSKFILDYAELADAAGYFEIAQICRKISSSKPETFREALQLTWFCHLVLTAEGRYAMALARLDQYLYPFYIRDIQSGMLDYDMAVSMLENTFIKILNANVVNICIGGVTRDGNDATNELSYAIVEAVKNVKMPGPNLSARFHSKTDKSFYKKCLECIKTGIGYPALFNDEVIIPGLVKYGYPIEDARDYSFVGCIETYFSGKQVPWTDGRFNTPKYLLDMMSDIDSDNITNLQDFDSFKNKLIEYVKSGAKAYTGRVNAVLSKSDPEKFTSPFLSSLYDNCIEKGLDINDGGAFYPDNHGACCMGLGTLSDSLAAIKYAVYDKKIVNLKELATALKANFEGHEELRMLLKSKPPKYGNDEDYVDNIAVWLVNILPDIFNEYRTPRGGHFWTLMAANVANIKAGSEIGATPDGRLAGKPLSDAASPVMGMDKLGVTAVINSVTKPDYTKTPGGVVINQKFNPSMFKDDNAIDRMVQLLHVYFQRGGIELQMNVISRKTLTEAREDPGRYPNLMVRVSGFSAYFSHLQDDVKDDIISRTEQLV